MHSKDTKQLELDKFPQEDEQIHDGDVQQNEYEEIQPALEKIEKNQDQILPIQDKIKKNRDEKDKKDDLKAKLSIEIGIDNNELYETVDNGIMKTVFRAKTMEDLAESEKEFLADFKRKMVAKRRFHEFSMNKKVLRTLPKLKWTNLGQMIGQMKISFKQPKKMIMRIQSLMKRSWDIQKTIYKTF